MTRARARSLWLAGPALIAACSSSPSAAPASSPATTPTTSIADTASATTTTTAASTTTAPSTTLAPATTVVPVDPSVLIPIAIGNKPFPADGDELATQHHGYTGDPNATLQAWLITPMAVPSGPDVRLLGFERAIGISSTTATFLTGPIDAEVALTIMEASLAPSPTYTVTRSTRNEGTVTIHGLEAQPTTVQGDPPGWSIEASVVDQLGIVTIKRIDYTFEKAVPAFADLPPTLQTDVLNEDAIAVNVGGLLTSIVYEYGVSALGETPEQRTRLSYDIANEFATATADLKTLLTAGWNISEQSDALYFTSTSTSEVWTLDQSGGATHLTYDTGS